eukprot:gnl/MRDRNA2_/MRDRNA2_134493_c0_seq1.p1 gnl/MRDRNA2_/MRDRNA2_134493_c0~~gnl/MRDRNA2_/MRDRNA2_134493_c0_seq1.p1  ORF type:complete len:268 (+),score=51.59 gnl/MRDRNA2_/MRDRNA2_134493_c0_seq1:91-894(+)
MSCILMGALALFASFQQLAVAKRAAQLKTDRVADRGLQQSTALTDSDDVVGEAAGSIGWVEDMLVTLHDAKVNVNCVAPSLYHKKGLKPGDGWSAQCPETVDAMRTRIRQAMMQNGGHDATDAEKTRAAAVQDLRRFLSNFFFKCEGGCEGRVSSTIFFLVMLEAIATDAKLATKNLKAYTQFYDQQVKVETELVRNTVEEVLREGLKKYVPEHTKKEADALAEQMKEMNFSIADLRAFGLNLSTKNQDKFVKALFKLRPETGDEAL